MPLPSLPSPPSFSGCYSDMDWASPFPNPTGGDVWASPVTPTLTPCPYHLGFWNRDAQNAGMPIYHIILTPLFPFSKGKSPGNEVERNPASLYPFLDCKICCFRELTLSSLSSCASRTTPSIFWGSRPPVLH